MFSLKGVGSYFWLLGSSLRDCLCNFKSTNLINLSRVSNPQKPVSIERRLKSWKNKYKFKWNHHNLSRCLNLNRGSNSLNSPSDYFIFFCSVKLFYFPPPPPSLERDFPQYVSKFECKMQICMVCCWTDLEC